ncbi:MAG: rRNA maturation RNAse YbeY, partial [Oscillochloris sp.]|nr:rRNA maturation RNAse YbeY [Oscillochloris sp.]
MAHLIEVNVAEGLEGQLPADLDLSLIEQAIIAVLQAEAQAAPLEVGVLITDDQHIHVLNRDYR